ncbi:hypothetical protein J6590_080678 [Homalodisca vitripennis]|nr:hypothetical protein J6590_080678 [Homalodisca vitripennis]
MNLPYHKYKLVSMRMVLDNKRFNGSEAAFGVSTVCVATLGQSVWKVSWSVFYIMVYAMEVAFYWFREQITEQPVGTIIIARCFALFIATYSFVIGITDYKTKISAALNMEAIEKKLDSATVSVRDKMLHKILVQAMFIVQFCLISLAELKQIMNDLSIGMARFITTFQSVGNILVQLYGNVAFMIKLRILNSTVTQSLAQIHHHLRTNFQTVVDSDSQESCLEYQLERHDLTQKMLPLLIEVQNSIHVTEVKIHSCYMVYIIWIRACVGGIIPIICTNVMKGTATSAYNFVVLSIFPAGLLWIIYNSQKLTEEKKNTNLQLTSCLVACRKNSHHFKRQLLANIHRSSSFTYYFFDLDYATCTDVIENALFVASIFLQL